MSYTAEYLRKIEWSMGNGQCPDCCGVPAKWHGQPGYMKPQSIGHKAECGLAAALVGVGEKPLMQGEFKSDVEYEHFISEAGFFGTRPKTATGCPRYAAHMEQMRQSAWRAVIEAWNEA